MNLNKFNSISNKLESHQRLIAVSKGQDLEKIKKLYEMGQRDFGENFLQELKEKKAILPSDIRWHFLGNIQSNKIKDIVMCSDLIHSIGRIKILNKISKLEYKKNIQIMLQLKLGVEETKSGFNAAEIYEIVKNNELTNITIKGLMVIAEGGIDKENLKLQFSQAKNVFEKIKTMNKNIEFLSMGMSNDYELALSHGSNMVRIGTLIFGARN
jgi:pyridoxal phosphate enzyme (YggS family)